MRIILVFALLLSTGAMAATDLPPVQGSVSVPDDCDEETLWTCTVEWQDGTESKISVNACNAEHAKQKIESTIPNVKSVRACGEGHPFH